MAYAPEYFEEGEGEGKGNLIMCLNLDYMEIWNQGSHNVKIVNVRKEMVILKECKWHEHKIIKITNVIWNCESIHESI